MKKKYFRGVVLLFCTFVAGLIPLHAANNKLEVALQSKLNMLDTEGSYVTKTIKNEDFEKGTFDIELKLQNAVDTEVMYVIDVLTNSNDVVKTNIKTLMDETFSGDTKINDIKVGFIRDGKTEKLTNDLTTAKSNIDDLFEGDDAGSATLIDLIKNAQKEFSSDCLNKVIVIITDKEPESSNLEGDKAYLQSLTDLSKIEDVAKLEDWNTYDLITLGIGLSENSNFEDLFGSNAAPVSGIVYTPSTTNLGITITATNTDDSIYAFLVDTLPAKKTNVVVTDYFPDYIQKYFDFSLVSTDSDIRGEVSDYNSETKSFTWNVGTLNAEETIALTYKLSLKADVTVDKAYLDIPLNTNERVIITYEEPSKSNTGNGNFDKGCSPKIKILSETVNPKTGIADYLVLGFGLLVVTAISYVVINKKEKFNRI